MAIDDLCSCHLKGVDSWVFFSLCYHVIGKLILVYSSTLRDFKLSAVLTYFQPVRFIHLDSGVQVQTQKYSLLRTTKNGNIIFRSRS